MAVWRRAEAQSAGEAQRAPSHTRASASVPLPTLSRLSPHPCVRVCVCVGQARHPLVFLLLFSAIASVTVVCSRAFSSILTDTLASGNYAPLLTPVALIALALIALTAVSSTYFLQQAMAAFDNNQVVPTYYVTFTLASVCAGALVYREFDCMTSEQPFLFALGCLCTFMGVWMTASASSARGGVSARTSDIGIGGGDASRMRHQELLEASEEGHEALPPEALPPEALPRARQGQGPMLCAADQQRTYT